MVQKSPNYKQWKVRLDYNFFLIIEGMLHSFKIKKCLLSSFFGYLIACDLFHKIITFVYR